MRGPISIFGGKHYMIKHLLQLIPPHKTYVEVFGGGAKLLFAKEPSPIEVYNDIDSNLVNFFRVLKDDKAFEEFYKFCICTPYSREIFYECRKDIAAEPDKVQRAWKFFVSAKMAFSGRHKSPSWSKCTTQSRRGMPSGVSSWISAIEGLQDVHNRLFRVLIEHQNFKKVILDADTKDTFYYLDPPYVQSVRKGKDRYPHELSDDEHQELVDILLDIKGQVMLSGYINDIYKQLEDAGWDRKDYGTSSFAAGRTKQTGLKGDGSVKETQKRMESIWLSPNYKKDNYAS